MRLLSGERKKGYSKNKSFNLFKEISIGIILFIIILIPFVKKLELHSFHGDENYWLRSSKYFKTFFIDRDFRGREWQKCKIPPVGKYIIGLALYITGYGDRIEELSRLKRWNFLKGYNWNVAHGRMPPKEMLYVVRLTMALFGSFTCLLIYWIGKKLFDIKAGIIASLLLAYNPLMLLCSKRAMTDAPLLFFLTVNILLTIYFYQFLLKQNFLKPLVFSALIGINSALATGTKLNGGLAEIIFLSFCMLFILVKSVHHRLSGNTLWSTIAQCTHNREIRIVLISILISVIIAIGMFVSINPCLYHQPLKGSKSMIDSRIVGIHFQQKHWGPLLDSLDKKASFMVRRTLLHKNYVILGTLLGIPIDFCLFLLGLLLLSYTEIKFLLNNARPSLKSILIIWTAITITGITAWLPFDWPRYYLPVIPCVVTVVGYCIDKMIYKGWSFFTSFSI